MRRGLPRVDDDRPRTLPREYTTCFEAASFTFSYAYYTSALSVLLEGHYYLPNYWLAFLRSKKKTRSLTDRLL